jgi:MFS family permease
MQQETGYEQSSKVSLRQNLRIVFGKPQTYAMAIYSFAIWAPIVVFAALWGIPFIKASYQLSTTQASMVGMMVWLGVGIGSPVFGWWSSMIGKRKLPLATSAFLGLLSAIVVVYFSIPLWMMYVALFVFGLGASGQSLIFAVVQDNNAPKSCGTAMGFNNLAVVAGGAILQPLAGYLIKIHGSSTMVASVPLYNIADFRYALLLLPVCYGVALIFSLFFIRETHCKEFKS